jgi:hypothetical protein
MTAQMGAVGKKALKGHVQLQRCASESAARIIFRVHGVEHYWDLAFSHALFADNCDAADSLLL